MARVWAPVKFLIPPLTAFLLLYFIFLSVLLYITTFNEFQTWRNSPSKNSPSHRTPDNILNMSDFISVQNNDQKIYNLDLYGPVNPSTSVVVIETHDSIHHINALIESLSKLHGNDNLLLIFSHDGLSPTVNERIDGIRFARVMQIFFPHSFQLHQSIYPDLLKNGSGYIPPSFQFKLHWWWNLNFVFERVKILRDFLGVISFTQADTYFVPNALTKLEVMEKAMIANMCGGCDALAVGESEELGTLSLTKGRGFLPDNLEGVVTPLVPPLHLAFNRTVWNKIKQCSREFCEYDDFNWDWTLEHVMGSNSCAEAPLQIFLLKYIHLMNSFINLIDAVS